MRTTTDLLGAIHRYEALVAGEWLLLKLAEYHPRRLSRSSNLHSVRTNLAVRRLQLALLYDEDKAGFRPDQPRWPKGSGRLSGRWMGGAGTAAPIVVSPRPRASPRAHAQFKGEIHHYVPREVFNNRALGLSKETRAAINQITTRPLYSGAHGWSKEHRVYNKAVMAEIKAFMKNNGITSGPQMTPQQGESFARSIINHNNPTIRGYNMHLHMREISFLMRRNIRGRGND